ncbi:hypothetical protein ASF61_00905 [Duganella sp. Leaf126]|uniref:hypothetical protein n=1 Tax=Duganella sp. Leaf126 TaxID=1736266 RepID=UPI0006F523C7|nr:hypothetical protein [Duganella sp. Leaf126]KQQ47244.1 hypothetical protein ASF61_00905 [Duganella sp. Leaf126]
MKNRQRALLGGVLLLAACAVLAAPRAPAARKADERGLPRYGMMVFSDLCINADSGEFGGQRITLQRFNEVDTVLYEYTAGGISWPVVASDVNIDPRGRQMYFTVQPPEEDERTISGKIVDGGKALVLDGGYCGDATVPMRLPLVTDFGRKAGVCHACPPQKEKQEAPAQDNGGA